MEVIQNIFYALLTRKTHEQKIDNARQKKGKQGIENQRNEEYKTNKKAKFSGKNNARNKRKSQNNLPNIKRDMRQTSRKKRLPINGSRQ